MFRRADPARFAAGYGVVRLWTAEAGTPADSGLGLAVTENRDYPCKA